VQEVIVVKVGGEGGGMTLIGRQPDLTELWEFRVEGSSSCAAILDEEDGGAAMPPRQPREPVWVPTLAEAVAMLDVWPWAMLVPIEVHPEFQDELLVEATRRLIGDSSSHAKRSMNRWLEACTQR
jgi:hypothetical protein